MDQDESNQGRFTRQEAKKIKLDEKLTKQNAGLAKKWELACAGRGPGIKVDQDSGKIKIETEVKVENCEQDEMTPSTSAASNDALSSFHLEKKGSSLDNPVKVVIVNYEEDIPNNQDCNDVSGGGQQNPNDVSNDIFPSNTKSGSSALVDDGDGTHKKCCCQTLASTILKLDARIRQLEQNQKQDMLSRDLRKGDIEGGSKRDADTISCAKSGFTSQCVPTKDAGPLDQVFEYLAPCFVKEDDCLVSFDPNIKWDMCKDVFSRRQNEAQRKLQKFGKNIWHFKICPYWAWESFDEYNHRLVLWLTLLPNLRSLHVWLHRPKSLPITSCLLDKEEESSQINLPALPNLVSLAVDPDLCLDDLNESRTYNALIRSYFSDQLRYLSAPNVHGTRWNERKISLNGVSELKITGNWSLRKTLNILDLCGATLQKLVIGTSSFKDGTQDRLLKKLNELQICALDITPWFHDHRERPRCGGARVRIPDWTGFSMPMLHTLRMRYTDKPGGYNFLGRMPALQNLELLVEGYLFGQMSPEDWMLKKRNDLEEQPEPQVGDLEYLYVSSDNDEVENDAQCEKVNTKIAARTLAKRRRRLMKCENRKKHVEERRRLIGINVEILEWIYQEPTREKTLLWRLMPSLQNITISFSTCEGISQCTFCRDEYVK